MFSPDGEAIPVTLISAEPNDITLRRNDAKDGYTAVQLALPKKGKHAEKKSTLKSPSDLKRWYAARKEFRGDVAEDVIALGVDQFEPGDSIEVVGVSKGKGYAGVVKRHNFKGGPASHGHKHVLRQAGSIGGGYPQHVFKGMRMAGRMGQDKVTVKNLVVVAVDAEKHVIAVKGAVPGTRGSIVSIRFTGEEK